MTAGQCIFRGRPFRSCATRRKHPCDRLASGSTLACTPTRARLSRTGVRLPPHPLERIERLEQLRPLAAGLAMGVALVTETPPVGVDTDEDLRRANADWTAFEERTR